MTKTNLLLMAYVPVFLGLSGCAVLAVADLAATVAVGTVGLVADAAIGTVRIAGKVVGGTVDAVMPGSSP